MTGDTHHGSVACPMDDCQCDDWPPTECPQCGVTTLGFTPEDWRDHFEEECHYTGQLYCFVADATEEARA